MHAFVSDLADTGLFFVMRMTAPAQDFRSTLQMLVGHPERARRALGRILPIGFHWLEEYIRPRYTAKMLPRHRALNPAGQASTAAASPQPEFCASLPSSTSAARALSGGGAGAWLDVLGSTLLRGGLISGGLYLYDRKDRQVLQKGLAGAAAIEVFVLGWTWWKLRRQPAS